MSRPIRFIQRPFRAERSEYDETIQLLLETLKNYEGVKGVYLLGNISKPGISDLDLLVVFHQNQECLRDPFEKLGPHQRRLFTHGIMAMGEGFFTDNERFGLWGKVICLYGENQIHEMPLRNEEEENALSVQTAMEFILANYIDLNVQVEYACIKLRSFLQHVKGIHYDLELLSIHSGEVYERVSEVRNWILQWPDTFPDDRKLSKWIYDYQRAFNQLCLDLTQIHPFWLDGNSPYTIARNMNLRSAPTLSFERNGLILPFSFVLPGSKVIKLQHRFNRFSFSTPIASKASSNILIDRMKFLRAMKAYNLRYLPGFMTMTTSITSKLIA